MKKKVTITYLEMLEAGQLQAKACPATRLTLEEYTDRWPKQLRFLYEWVGRDWLWTERLEWTEAQWIELAGDKNTRTWIGYVQKTIAGYFELNKQGKDVEIKYFGMTPEWFGKGYGGYLLSEAIRQAWAWGAKRVWVHTCTLDHEAALPNYQARGMTIYKTETVEKEL